MLNNEYRLFGPPGTGKTTAIAHMISNASNKYAVDEIVACSFTRAAAKELTNQRTHLPKENIGTIHSLCYHQLGQPKLIEVEEELINEWNDQYPEWKIQSGETVIDEPVRGDELMQYNRWRSKLRPENGLNVDRNFVAKWEDFKSAHDAMDFCDLLENAPDRLPNIKVLFVDEAQDLTPLQFKIVRQWGMDIKHLTMAGDDDQLLYNFLGADPDHFLTNLPEENIRILDQSHRLSRAVHKRAEQWIQRLGNRRQKKEYKPRDEKGTVKQKPLQLDSPERLIEDIRQNDEVMVLATCSYMLRPLLKHLRNKGIPFHNPYRTSRGDWNPLGHTAERLINFLMCCDRFDEAPAWQWNEWIQMVRSADNLQRGAKTELRGKANREGRVTKADLENWLTPELLRAMDNKDVDWLKDNSTKRFNKALEFPVRIYHNQGISGLRQDPDITVGTIHSVKGGEASTVYLFPDISNKAYKRIESGTAMRRSRSYRDAMIRQAYVGMTRAKTNLYLCQSGNNRSWSW